MLLQVYSVTTVRILPGVGLIKIPDNMDFGSFPMSVSAFHVTLRITSFKHAATHIFINLCLVFLTSDN